VELCFLLLHNYSHHLTHSHMIQWHRTSEWQLSSRSFRKYFSHSIVSAFVKTFSMQHYCQRSLKFFSNCCWEHPVNSKDTCRELEMATSGVEECPWRTVIDPPYPCAEGHSAAAPQWSPTRDSLLTRVFLKNTQYSTGKGKDRNVMAIYTVLKMDTIITTHLLCTRYKVHARLTWENSPLE
jgi:hypothetical protein